MNKLFSGILIFFAITQFSAAQDFKWESEIQGVKENGFYNILLAPQITTHLKQDLSDIRIYDQEGKEVPYILTSENSSSSNEFKEYAITENKSIPKCCTHLTLHNAGRSPINNISLMIRNSDVRKNARLSGSDDQISWYIIKDDYRLESVYNDQRTSEVKIINFPLSDYEFYKLEISDSSSAPLKIIKAGFYDNHYEEAKFISLPAPVVLQKDSSNKHSYIKLSFGQLQYIDRLKIEVEQPGYFLRNARLCKHVKEKSGVAYETLATAELRSNHENYFHLDFYPATELYLIVENKDNIPLKIKSVTGHQLVHYMTAQLEKDNKYYLRMGNPTITYPEYDLQFFKDNIPDTLTAITPAGPVNIEKEDSLKKADFFSSPLWIWSAIIAVVVLLGYSSFKMIREIK